MSTRTTGTPVLTPEELLAGYNATDPMVDVPCEPWAGPVSTGGKPFLYIGPDISVTGRPHRVRAERAVIARERRRWLRSDEQVVRLCPTPTCVAPAHLRVKRWEDE